MSKKPVVLMILDGYGLNKTHEGNAVYEAKKPVMDRLMKECPFVEGQASGLAVGLPEGQMGNSEVGHLNMGAGRIVYQELTRITKSIQDGDFFKNEEFLAAVDKFLSSETNENPILFEVFTETEDESNALEILCNVVSNPKYIAKKAIKGAVKQVLGDKGVKVIKSALGK